jgi:hypothetical protein
MTRSRWLSSSSMATAARVVGAALPVLALIACGTSLSNQDAGRLHHAQTDLYYAENGKAPANNVQIACCQIPCVLVSSDQNPDPDGGTLPCPPCSSDAGVSPPPPSSDAGSVSDGM